MSTIDEILTDVQKKIAPTDETLATARARRDEVLNLASTYPGALRRYASGSIAHRTANDDTDADCGVVLDRRSYPELGPDGKNGDPGQIVEALRTFLRDGLKEEHNGIAFRVTKRAIKVSYNEPLPDGSDPSVDLIVALTRAQGALWIPNLERSRWDASDPEYHTKVLTAEPVELRRTRAKVIRLAKGWNKQYSQPGLCSFNIEALALEAVKDDMTVAEGLAAMMGYAAGDLAKRQTPDPAGVSAPIKTLIDRETAVGRLKTAAETIGKALVSKDDTSCRDCLAELYWHYVTPATEASKAAWANALRQGNSAIRVSSGGLSLGNIAGASIKTTRSYGGGYL